MDGESTAFLSQVLEVDRAIDNLAKSGRLYQGRNATNNQYNTSTLAATSRYPITSHYASQRPPHMTNHRGYQNTRSVNAMQAGPQGYPEYGNQYYPPPPPPLQQQYPHTQQTGMYSGTTHLPSPPPSTSSTSLGHYADDVGGPYSNSRYNMAPRPHSPFGASTLPPMSRLNTGGAASSSHSTTPSVTCGMSSSMSMLPPGHGRDAFTPATTNAHVRAHSVAGSLSGHVFGPTSHSRKESINQGSEALKGFNGDATWSNAAGVFGPSSGHSRATSFSTGAPASASPSSAAFNFFSPPPAQGSSSMQSSYVSSTNAIGSSRFAPIGRPVQNRSSADLGSGVRANNKSASNTGPASGVTSGVTSPLSNNFPDGWLDQVTSAETQNMTSSMNEGQFKSLQSVWNN